MNKVKLDSVINNVQGEPFKDGDTTVTLGHACSEALLVADPNEKKAD